MTTKFPELDTITANSLLEHALKYGDLYSKEDVFNFKQVLGGQDVLNIIGGLSLHLFLLCYEVGLDVQEAYDISVELCAFPPANKEQADALDVNKYIENHFNVE
jgi:hypothetical protein